MIEPWEKYPSIWRNQTAFFTYLRGHLRLLWSRYPAKNEWKTAQMQAPPKGYTGRAKSLGTCHYCKECFGKSALEVDHVQQAGQCNSWETAQQFLRNLLDCNDNWVLACSECHKIKSHQEKNEGMTFAEAATEKECIRIMKLPTKEILDFCQAWGYNSSELTNAAKRREAALTILKGNAKCISK